MVICIICPYGYSLLGLFEYGLVNFTDITRLPGPGGDIRNGVVGGVMCVGNPQKQKNNIF